MVSMIRLMVQLAASYQKVLATDIGAWSRNDIHMGEGGGGGGGRRGEWGCYMVQVLLL